MNKLLKKYWRRFLVWTGIQEIQEEEIKKLLRESITVREQTECDHKMLSALFPADIWYRCTQCNQLWIVTQAMTINADKLPELIKKFQMVAKIKPKNIRDRKLTDMQKDDVHPEEQE
jgi:acetyl-CoA carboxylase beta subunit